ncbi:MAG TPA: CoA pyrophosphatase [Pirellulales bacterium]|jgi:8-oxo-dGTP pyrophosphatase MutT (NUDIX family)|nr:CoA pyrophosphatase [Pirellulales bacterium]
MDSRWIDQIRAELRRPLPGIEAQRRMAPMPLSGPYFASPPEGARRAAVMLLLYPADDGWRLPLIVRPKDLSHHGGQIGLPGGLIEAGETTWQAALRELEEEIGVKGEGIGPLGQLSPLYVFVSNNFVTPWVATIARIPTFLMNAAEVAEVIELPMATFLDVSQTGEFSRDRTGNTQRVPYFAFGTHRIWGATAMILAEFAAVLQAVAHTEK